MLLPWKEWAMWQSSMPPVLALHFFVVCVCPRNAASRNAACRDKVCPQESRVSFSIQGIVSAKSIQVPPRQRWVAPLIFSKKHTCFFYDLCSSSPSSKEFVLSLNKLFQLPGDEMWWMINVVHPMNFHIGMVYATHFSGMLKGQVGSLAGIIPAEHKCQGQSWCEYGFIMIYLSTYLIVYLCVDLSNCLFIYPIIYLSTCLPT